jgi:hypothetical protein
MLSIQTGSASSRAANQGNVRENPDQDRAVDPGLSDDEHVVGRQTGDAAAAKSNR